MVRIIAIIVLLAITVLACDDDSTSAKPTGQDTLIATISGSKVLEFSAQGVNVNIYPQDGFDLALYSGTMIENTSHIYSVYFALIDSSDTYTFDLAGSEGFTRFEYDIGMAGAIVYGDSISGKVVVSEVTKDYIKGSFDFEAVNNNGSGKVSITNGYFVRYKN